MKILLVHNLWTPYVRGGGERMLALISEELRRRGDEVVVVSLRPWFKKPTRQTGVYYLGSGYHFLNSWPVLVRLVWQIGTAFNIVKYFQLKKIINKEAPDILWTHNLNGFGMLGFTLGHLVKRHVHTLHDIQLLHPSGLLMYGQEGLLRKFHSLVYQALGRSFISSAMAVISPSHWLLELHRERGFFSKNPAAVIPNPTPFTVIEKKLVPHPTFDFLYVGQFEAHKGVEVLLDAFQKFSNPSVRLRLIGDGSLLEKSKNHYGDDSRIQFLGRQPSDKVEEIMKNSDCLAVPSLCYENFPTVILEARALGLPVIGSDFGGVRELVSEEYVCKPTVEALYEKMKWIVENSDALTVKPEHRYLSVADYLRAVGEQAGLGR